MQVELILLRLIHILGGTFWVGSAVFMTFFLVPAMQKAGGATAGQIMAGLQQRRMMLIMPIVAVLTILSGMRMWWIVGGGMHYFQHRSGHALAISGILAILALVIGLAVTRPTASRIGTLARSAASDETSRKLIQEEIARLQRRATVWGYIVLTLLVVAAAGMAVARYL
jgi:uncharacterized membrane protein